MVLLYKNDPLFLGGFEYQLGSKQRGLAELKADQLLLGDVEALSAIGYRNNLGLSEDESLLSMATAPVSRVLERTAEPRALVFQHCYTESAVAAYHVEERHVATRTRYFPAEVLRNLKFDHLPYFGSFASGCAGFISLLATAGGLFSSPDGGPAVCAMADAMPTGVPYDILQERIVGSDHASAFVVGREQRGYQLLGLAYYSTTRTNVPFVEIVKRTVEMIQQLAGELDLKLTQRDVAIHYPNIFPETWQMVTRYLRIPVVQHILDGMAERAHCMASDSIISLSKLHRGQEDRLHVVVNYGVGLHLGVCILQEALAV